MNTARANDLDAYAPTDRFTLTPRGVEYLAARASYDPSADPAMNPAALPDAAADDPSADYDDRDEAFTGAEYTNDLAPADDADVIPFP